MRLAHFFIMADAALSVRERAQGGVGIRAREGTVVEKMFDKTTIANISKKSNQVNTANHPK